MAFCPFRSTADVEVNCNEKCALHTPTGCSLKNIGTLDFSEFSKSIHDDINSLTDQIYEVGNALLNK